MKPDPESHSWVKTLKELPPRRMLPEWIWRLRAAWVSTLAYQTIRDGISDYIFDIVILPSVMAKKMSTRRVLNPDYKIRLYNEKTLARAVDKQSEEFGGTEAFCYAPLNSAAASTRFLLLSPGDAQSLIQLTLEEHSLYSGQGYEALSYAWGDDTYHNIECNGKLLKVRENAWLALQSLRQDGGGQRRLWIDAICIDQSDLQERSAQVLLMRRIYEQASRVVVWMGPPSPGTQSVFQLLKSISKARAAEDVEQQNQPFTAKDLELRGLPGRSEKVWVELDMFFWQNWFVRVWIIQEIAVARIILFRCGHYTCPYDDVEAASDYISSHSLTAVTGVDPSKFIRLNQFRQDHLQGSLDLSRLELLLCRARASYSTDARDKIFGILGLLQQSSSLISLVPDYSSNYARVYIDATRLIIESAKSLDVLSATDDHRGSLTDELPSWVPDWEISQPRFIPFCTSTAFANWQAARDVVPCFKYSADGTRLCVTGYLADSIEHVSDSFLEFTPIIGGNNSTYKLSTRSDSVKALYTNTVDFFAQQRWRQWEKMSRNLKTYPTGEPIMDVFVKTITAEYDFGRGHPPLDLYNSWKRIWEKSTMDEGRRIDAVHGQIDSGELSDALHFMEVHWRAAFGRRLFTTSSGYVGIGPARLRRGMIVSILGGGRTPYVLRKKDKGCYAFIGECYMHGAMNGQLRPGLENLKDIWIV